MKSPDNGKISFEKSVRDWPETYYLSRNGEALLYSPHRFLYLIDLDYSSGKYVIKQGDESVSYKYITREEYEWILAHPEEIYMELMLS